MVKIRRNASGFHSPIHRQLEQLKFLSPIAPTSQKTEYLINPKIAPFYDEINKYNYEPASRPNLQFHRFGEQVKGAVDGNRCHHVVKQPVVRTADTNTTQYKSAALFYHSQISQIEIRDETRSRDAAR